MVASGTPGPWFCPPSGGQDDGAGRGETRAERGRTPSSGVARFSIKCVSPSSLVKNGMVLRENKQELCLCRTSRLPNLELWFCSFLLLLLLAPKLGMRTPKALSWFSRSVATVVVADPPGTISSAAVWSTAAATDVPWECEWGPLGPCCCCSASCLSPLPPVLQPPLDDDAESNDPSSLPAPPARGGGGGGGLPGDGLLSSSSSASSDAMPRQANAPSSSVMA